MQKRIGLVLGSGGARGIAHIGVLDWLDEHDFEIHSISGCSMGALVGGIYAAGELQQFKQWLLALEKTDVIRLLDFSFQSKGVFKGDKIINLLRELVGDHAIENLPLHYTSVATDIDTEREVWFREGSLFDSIRASIAIPGVFTPVEYQGRRLVDGGLLNPLPIAPTFAADVDTTLAVNLCAPNDPRFDKQPLNDNKPATDGSYRQKVTAYIGEMYNSFERAVSDSMQFYDIFNLSVDTMQGALSRMKLAAYPPDITLDVPRNICSGYEFYQAEALIEFGYQLAEQELGPLLKKRLEQSDVSD
jgi:NTE family protein